MEQKKISFFSSNDKIGLALLISSGFYYYERSFIFSSKLQILTQSLVLLIFSYFFFIIINFVIKYLNKIQFNYVKKIFYTLIFTWLVVLSIKSIFFLINYISLSELLIKLLNIKIEFVSKNELFKRTLIFILPYILCFILILVFYRNLDKIKKLLITFGFISLIVIPIDLFQSKKPINLEKNYSHLEEASSNLKPLNLKRLENKRKVLLIIFDEFDYELTFENFDYLKNILKISRKGFFAKKMFPPAINTITSIPSILLGEPTKGNYYVDDEFYLVSQNNNIINFNLENSLFGKLENTGYKYTIFSTGVDYCTTLKINKNCKAKKFNELKSHNNLFKGVSFTFSLIDKSFLFFKLLMERKMVVENFHDIQKLNVINKNFKDIDGHRLIYFDDFKNTLNNENLDFIYLHLSLPHLPSDYAEKTFNVRTPKDMRAYLLNLKLLDIIMDKIYITYKESKFYQNSLVILTSDHWARDKDTSQSKAFPVFFFSKIYNDYNNIDSEKKMSSVNLSNFIIDYFNGEINTNKEIKKFFEENKFYKTYLPKLDN